MASKNFPDLTQAYQSLGITAKGAGIELAPEGREKQLRDAIMETGVVGKLCIGPTTRVAPGADDC